VLGFGTYQFYQFRKRENMFKGYYQGLELHEAGVKASDMGPMYYNEKRDQPDFTKCTIDTSQKVRYGQSVIEFKVPKS
jgi:hypothetical protein